MKELEVKFYLSRLSNLEEKLKILGAERVQPRTLESNLRFDTPDRRLEKGAQVLRLRKDTAARMTYKGPGEIQKGVRSRTEIEFTVSDFDTARDFLEALGYEVSFIYEKYRTVYDLEGLHIALDEMPYGNFAEVEGPDPTSIHAACMRLELDWDARCSDSYTGLFKRMHQRLGFGFEHSTFANFERIRITPLDLGVRPADKSG